MWGGGVSASTTPEGVGGAVVVFSKSLVAQTVAEFHHVTFDNISSGYQGIISENTLSSVLFNNSQMSTGRSSGNMWFSGSGDYECISGCPAGFWGNCRMDPFGACSSCKVPQECFACPSGRYRATAGATRADECLACAPGYFASKSPKSGAVSCHASPGGSYSIIGIDPTSSGVGVASAANATWICPAGKYSKQGSYSCTSCSAGKSSLENATECFACPSGKYSDTGATCIKCPSGRYTSSKGSLSCAYCPSLKTSFAGSSGCHCETSYVSVPNSMLKRSSNTTIDTGGGAFWCKSCSSLCDTCEDAAEATSCDEGSALGSVFLEQGYWRSRNESYIIRSCIIEANCRGGTGRDENGTGYCTARTHGPMCALCKSAYYELEGSCALCEGTSSTSDLVIAMACSLLAVMVIGVALCVRSNASKTAELAELAQDPKKYKAAMAEAKQAAKERMEAFVASHSSFSKEYLEQQEERIERMARKLKGMMTKLKICLTFFQLSSTANFNLGVKMPAFFTGLMNKLAPIVAIQPISFMPIACTSEFARTYAFTLFTNTLGPILMFLIIGATGLGVSYATKQPTIRATTSSILLLFSHTIFPGSSSVVLNTFFCDDDFDDGERYMKLDYSTSCNSAEYRWLVAYAVCMVFVFPIGIPATYILLLRAWKDSIDIGDDATEEQLEARPKFLHFLYHDFRPKYYWFGK